MWLPSSSLAVVNVSYSPTGQLVGLQRGSMSERTEFDSQGRVVSRSFVDGKVWSYSYLDKVSASIFVFCMSKGVFRSGMGSMVPSLFVSVHGAAPAEPEAVHI